MRARQLNDTQSLTDATLASKVLPLVNPEGGGRLSTSICLEQANFKREHLPCQRFLPPLLCPYWGVWTTNLDTSHIQAQPEQ